MTEPLTREELLRYLPPEGNSPLERSLALTALHYLDRLAETERERDEAREAAAGLSAVSYQIAQAMACLREGPGKVARHDSALSHLEQAVTVWPKLSARLSSSTVLSREDTDKLREALTRARGYVEDYLVFAFPWSPKAQGDLDRVAAALALLDGRKEPRT